MQRSLCVWRVLASFWPLAERDHTPQNSPGTWTCLAILFRRSSFYAFIAIGISARLAHGQDYGDTQRHQEVLFSGQVVVPPGKRYTLPFTTRSNFKNARIAGSVQARGGAGNDIRVLVTKGQSIAYDSGQRRSAVLSVDFSEPGQYILIFDNSFSLVSPKVVAGVISLVHWGVDVEQNDADRQASMEHLSQASRIIQKLYSTLKAQERIWGTTQLFALPTIRLDNDRSINASANWSTNSIKVNRGLFDLTGKAADKGDDVLAATLAHELSHIFYRHPGYGSGQGLKGFYDELRGVTALDRVQEHEADILGTRVACQAGFDPDGMLILVTTFASMDGSASSFMRNHPSGVERLQYLQTEASKCRTWQEQHRQSAVPIDDTRETGTEGTGRQTTAQEEMTRALVDLAKGLPPPGPPAKGDNDCLKYQSAPVSLRGTLVSHQNLNNWWAVKLARSICTVNDPSDPSMVAYNSVGELQLILGGQADLDRCRNLLGREVAVSGKLIPQVTAHHQTRVLIIVDQIEPISPVKVTEVPIPVATRAAGISALPDAPSYIASATVVPSPTRRVIKQAWDNDPSRFFPESDRFIEHFFNGPSDIMWVKCLDGYTITESKSSSGTSVFQMDPGDTKNPYWGVAVSVSERSNITVRCSR